jgi:hypothetical protein
MGRIPDSLASAEVQIVGKPAKDVKHAVFLWGNRRKKSSGCAGKTQARSGRSFASACKTPDGSFCNTTTRNCIFTLDTTSTEAHNPGNFSGWRAVHRVQGVDRIGKRNQSGLNQLRVISF